MRHLWEEPCISGMNGSGAVFFSGCNLGCSFCQNYEISNPKTQKKESVSAEWLEIELFRLKDLGCHNIDFITGSHIAAELIPVMRHAIKRGIKIPFVWNSSAYETEAQIKTLEPYIDIYLPDLKFFDPELSSKIAGAPDYFETAGKAVKEMLRQRPQNIYHVIQKGLHNVKTTSSGHSEQKIDIHTDGCHDNINFYENNLYLNHNDTKREGNILNFDAYDDQVNLMDRGVLIRHLVLPGFYKDSIKILEWIEANLSSDVSLSLMSQYIPDYYEKGCRNQSRPILPSLTRKLTTFEYEKVLNRAIALGFHDVFIQKRESADHDYVPEF
jgi:putative pyruvate formate lyase activating enzyme